MRTDWAASESAISSSRLEILLTRSPSPGCSLKVVTVGPAIQPTTRALRPNSSKVDCNDSAVCSSSLSEDAEDADCGLARRISSGGSLRPSSWSPSASALVPSAPPSPAATGAAEAVGAEATETLGCFRKSGICGAAETGFTANGGSDSSALSGSSSIENCPVTCPALARRRGSKVVLAVSSGASS